MRYIEPNVCEYKSYHIDNDDNSNIKYNNVCWLVVFLLIVTGS